MLYSEAIRTGKVLSESPGMRDIPEDCDRLCGYLSSAGSLGFVSVYTCCVYELREEIAIFLEEDNRPETENFHYFLFVMKLSYLVVIFEKLNELNLQLQGVNTHMLDTSDKVNAFCKKLELWGRNLKQKNLTMFENVDNCTKTFKAEEEHVKVVFATIENHLAMLARNFKKYFPADDKLIASYEWVRNPFHKTPERLSIDEEEKFIDFTTRGEIKIQFNKSLFGFRAGG
ncbi:zinc finger BED domain-containing protein 5-like [Parasteatoda tepidariorum]|uniref:zinc finger BED domain-containing protein 5-like n=1 Tax=Parasteatoda tepidariorum TaxID=114398 RepID=UPI0039BC998A